VKTAINIQANDTREKIIESTPNIAEFDIEYMEIAINTWLTSKNKVIISTNVIIFKVRMSLNFQKCMIPYLFITIV
jgi:hypothetical protein